MEDDATDRLKIDYEHTVSYLQLLADTRFKLLALVPIASGVGLSLTESTTRPKDALAIGLLGFLVTLGIIIYDQRNTQIYDALVARAKLLEAQLRLPRVGHERTPFGGPFLSRPLRGQKFVGLFEMWHDRGLAIIYATAMAGWAYIIVTPAARLLGLHRYTGLFEVGFPSLVWLVLLRQLQIHDWPTPDPRSLSPEVQSTTDEAGTSMAKNEPKLET